MPSIICAGCLECSGKNMGCFGIFWKIDIWSYILLNFGRNRQMQILSFKNYMKEKIQDKCM